MNKAQLIANPNSCLNRAADDEPVFLLRANDETAPSLIWQWSRAYLEAKGGRIDENGDVQGLTPEQKTKFETSLEDIELFQQWKAAQK